MIIFTESIEGTSRLRNPRLSARDRGAEMLGTGLSCGTCEVQLQHPQRRNTCILAFVLIGLS
jgi:hypothetical protein